MEGKKTYYKPKAIILETIHDIIELQNGSMVISDAIRGKVLYRIAMYGHEWQILYTVTAIKKEESQVTIRLTGERRDKVKEIRRQFALLDSMLNGGDQVEITQIDEEKRKPQLPTKKG